MPSEEMSIVVTLPEEEYTLFINLINADLRLSLSIYLEMRMKKSDKIDRLVEFILDYYKIITLVSPTYNKDGMRQFVYYKSEVEKLCLILSSISRDQLSPEFHQLYDSKYEILMKVFYKAQNLKNYEVNIFNKGVA